MNFFDEFFGGEDLESKNHAKSAEILLRIDFEQAQLIKLKAYSKAKAIREALRNLGISPKEYWEHCRIDAKFKE